MQIVEIDGVLVTGKRGLHAYLAKRLDFPDYYGHNLDALYDLLMSRQEETEIRLVHLPALQATLGDYANKLIKLLANVAEKNAFVTIIL